MRYFLLLPFLLAGSIIHAQSLSLGVRGGTNLNSAPLNKDPLKEPTGTGSFWPGIRAAVDLKKFQFGAGFDYGRYKYETGVPTSFTPGTRMVSSTPLSYAYLFANYKLNLPKSFAYFGLTAGYATLGDKLNILTTDKTQWKVGGQGSSLSGGVQLGYNLSLSKRWSIQGEAGARYLPLNVSYTWFYGNGEPYEIPVSTGAFSFPITIGINYTLFKR